MVKHDSINVVCKVFCIQYVMLSPSVIVTKMARNRVQNVNALHSVPILWLLGHVMTELGTTSSILKVNNARHLSTVGVGAMKIVSLPTWTVYMHATLTVSLIMFTSHTNCLHS